jgi:hypothetical protein
MASRDGSGRSPGSTPSAGRAEGEQLGALDLIELWPTMMRMGLVASLRGAGWLTSSTIAAWRRVGAAALARESPITLMEEARDEVRRAARQALGVVDLEERLGRVVSTRPPPADAPAATPAPLRERGRDLLHRSASVDPQEDAYPAFGLILEQLAPDEARILRVLATQGAQPAVDVKATSPVGIGDSAVAERLSMIGDLAGCRHPERLSLYLDNLERLGLVRFDDEPLEEEEPYYALEAQPAVSEAQDEASSGITRAKIPRRRLELTDFGRRFCEACLPLEDDEPE